jgi:hypothetical protein
MVMFENFACRAFYFMIFFACSVTVFDHFGRNFQAGYFGEANFSSAHSTWNEILKLGIVPYKSFYFIEKYLC